MFLEAMAAGKPIVAARAAAVPEVVRHGMLLVEPKNPEALAEGIRRLYRDTDLRGSLASSASRDVEEFEMRRVARRFLSTVATIAPLRIAERHEVEDAG